jgi:hypothetical protein
MAAPAAQDAPAFMVFNPATGGYQQKEIPSMAAQIVPAPAQPVQQAVTQSVLVLDPATGQYTRREMTLALDSATGQYMPVSAPAQPQAAAQTEKERLRAEKEAQALERRNYMDSLRDERAGRARKNDSLLGRVQNTAISTATRTVVSQLTRGLLGSLIGKK